MAQRRRIDRFTHAGMTFDVSDSGFAVPSDGDGSDAGDYMHARNTAVLLHGFPQTARSWDAVALQLNEAGYRTLAVDQRGYSPGARPEGRRAYRLDLLVRDAVALIERIGTGPVHLVGHDWGAAVAWVLAAARPDLVRTLTAVSVPHPGAFVRSMLSSSQIAHSYYMLLFQFPRLPERIAHNHPRVFDAMLRRTGMADEAIARVHGDLIDSGALTYAINWYRAMPLSRPGVINKPVRVPTTYVWSDGDVALTRRGAELSGEYVRGDYRFEIFGGVSHWVPEEAPERLARAILARAGG